MSKPKIFTALEEAKTNYEDCMERFRGEYYDRIMEAYSLFKKEETAKSKYVLNTEFVGWSWFDVDGETYFILTGREQGFEGDYEDYTILASDIFDNWENWKKEKEEEILLSEEEKKAKEKAEQDRLDWRQRSRFESLRKRFENEKSST